MVLIIVSSDYFPQDAAATVSTMEAASVEWSTRCVQGGMEVLHINNESQDLNNDVYKSL